MNKGFRMAGYPVLTRAVRPPGVIEVYPRPSSARMGERKAFEDTLEAVICAWVAVRALEGLAVPFGDDNAAIWIPMRRR
jgi:hypothetical protein